MKGQAKTVLRTDQKKTKIGDLGYLLKDNEHITLDKADCKQDIKSVAP